MGTGFTTDRDLGDEDDFKALFGVRMTSIEFLRELDKVDKQLFARMEFRGSVIEDWQWPA